MKYRKNNTEVDAIQFDGTIKSIDQIKELLGDKSDRVHLENSFETTGIKTFSLIGKKSYTIYTGEWIMRDGIHDFVISDNIFTEMFTEIK